MRIESGFQGHFLLIRLFPLKTFLSWITGISLLQSLAGGEIPHAAVQENPWKGSVETQIGYESNIYQIDRHIEPVTGSWFSESSLEWGRSWEHEHGSHEFVLEAEYKTYFYTNTLEEYRLQPGLIWHEAFSDGCSLDIDFRAAVLRAKVEQEFINEPDETEEAIGAGTGFQFKKVYPDHSSLKWSGRIEGEIFEYMAGSNLGCRSEIEAVRPLGGDTAIRAGISWEWQGYRHMTWSGQPSDEPPELNTMSCRAFAGLAGAWNKNWDWKLTVTGGPDFDLDGGYYNALTFGLRARLTYHSGRWSLAAKLDPETAFFSNRPAVLGAPSPALIAQDLWAGTEAAYEIFSGCEIFAAASWGLQWTNGGHSENAALNSFDDFVVRSGLRVEF